ncbi:MAG: lipid-A-disaccharide synthase [Candidatus Babeliales bacterium]|jgi:lipid-A-disaccharide synthase
MNKIFIVAGEVSGDRLAAWYVKRLRVHKKNIYIEAVGGASLQAEGVKLFEHLTSLNVVGVVEIIRHLPSIMRFMRRLGDYIIAQDFDTVMVVDFPGFNLRLIKQLKQRKPSLKIIYLSPPQLWCWGAWRVRTLKKYTDQVIVLYPFEVEWYRKRGLAVTWQGSPVYEMLEPYRKQSVEKKTCIALIPGSRNSEIITMLPLFLQSAALLLERHPELTFVIPVAPSMDREVLKRCAEQHNLMSVWEKVMYVSDEHEKFMRLANCSCALSKPGTVTLELALLRVPTVIAFKVSWLTYLLARLFVRVKVMGLPNLLLDAMVAPEVIQFKCRPDVLAQEIEKVYSDFVTDAQAYRQRMNYLEMLARKLSS